MNKTKKALIIFFHIYLVIFAVNYFFTFATQPGIYINSKIFLTITQIINAVSPVIFFITFICMVKSKTNLLTAIKGVLLFFIGLWSLLGAVYPVFPIHHDIDIDRNRITVSPYSDTKYVLRVTYELRSTYINIGEIKYGFIYVPLGKIRQELSEQKIEIKDIKWENDNSMLISCHIESVPGGKKDCEYRFNTISGCPEDPNDNIYTE